MATASRTLGIGGLFLVVTVVLAAAAMAPRAGAQLIQACDDGLDGNITNSQYNGSFTFRTNTCFANAITGLSSVTSFAYYLALYSGADAPLHATAIVIDEAARYIAVESIDISDLLPTTSGGEAQAVTALFASPVALDPLRTYLLAFCATGTSSFVYNTSVSQEARLGVLL
jgi:hypothetical protein